MAVLDAQQHIIYINLVEKEREISDFGELQKGLVRIKTKWLVNNISKISFGDLGSVNIVRVFV